MTAGFDEVLFPIYAGFGSQGGPARNTQIVVTGSGGERRNARWANSRRKYVITLLRSDDEIHSVVEFWEARNAKTYGFRLRDLSDYKSCAPLQNHSANDQIIGTGTGTFQEIQLIKTYVSGPRSWVRTIKKPVAGTVKISYDSVEQPSSAFTVDTTTGLVGCSPPNGVTVRAGYWFDTGVRFDTDDLQINWKEPRANAVQSIPMIELPLEDQ